jgi:protein-tyrosine phosphatase
MDMTRHLDWENTYNVRDLGGLPTIHGGTVRRGALVRGDAPSRLTAAGWSTVWSHGIRTVIDLRATSEIVPNASPRPAGIRAVQVPLDDHSDTEFWERWGGGLDCTPLYYAAFLQRFPQRIAEVLGRIADAPPGGVFVHCSGGRDRTGLIVMLLLALAEVPNEVIAEDYELSATRLDPLWREMGLGDQTAGIARLLKRNGTTAHECVVQTVASLKAEAYLRSAGLTAAQLRSLRTRVIDNGA